MMSFVLIFSVLVAASAAQDTFTYHQCNCQSGACPTQTNLPSGVCQNTVPFISASVKSKSYTCATTLSTCAKLVYFKDGQCSQFRGTLQPLCGKCQKLGIPGVTPGDLTAYAFVECDEATQKVTVSTGCDSTCDKSKCKAQEVHLYDTCSASNEYANTWVSNTGITQCSYATVQEYASSTTCSGAPTTVRYIGQDFCSEDGLIHCNNQPAYQPEAGTTVLSTQCEHGCSSGCTYRTFQSNTCVPYSNPYKAYRKVTCGGVGKCVNMLMYQDAECQDFGTFYEAQCGSCAVFSAQDGQYAKLDCDLTTGAVTVTLCEDKTCTSCRAPDPVRKPFVCAQVPSFSGSSGNGPGFASAENMGITQCTTVTDAWYSAPDCNEDSLTSEFFLGDNLCTGGSSLQCGNFQLQSVASRQCTVSSTADPGQLDTFPASSCVLTGQPGTSRQVDCVTKSQTCVFTTYFSDAQCTTFAYFASPVCGQCMKDGGDGAPANAQYHIIVCNEFGQSVYGLTGCDSNCQNCQGQTATTLVNSNQCVLVSTGLYVQVGSMRECDAVRVSYWDQSETCEGSPTTINLLSDGKCNAGESLTCSEPAQLNGSRTLPLEDEQVYVTSCPDGCGMGDCHRYRLQDGQCSVRPDFDAANTRTERFTCKKDGLCVMQILHDGADCAPHTFAGVRPLVCGTCTQLPFLEHRGLTPFLRVACNPATQNVWIDMDCDSTCTNCNQTGGRWEPIGECRTHRDFSVRNWEMFPCDTVQVEKFTSDDCTGSSLTGTAVFNYTSVQDLCAYGQSATCGRFGIPPPNLANITVEPCWNCGVQPACFPTTVLPSETCQLLPSFPDASVVLACGEKPQLCATFALYGETGCEHFTSTASVVCGSCNLVSNNMTVKYFCDPHGMTVTSYSSCNADCSVCANPRGIRSSLDVCSDVDITFSDVATRKLLSIRSCDVTLAMISSNNRLCQGVTNAVMYEQGTCQAELGINLQCNNAPSLVGLSNATEVLQTKCTDAICSENCVATVMASGTCNAVGASASRKFTCEATQGQTCASYLWYQGNATCSGDFVLRSGPCGRCTQDPVLGNVFVQCTVRSITIQPGCDSACANCDAAISIPLDGTTTNSRCVSATTGPTLSIFGYAVEPCNTVRVDEWAANADCSGGATRTSYLSDGGGCSSEYGRVQCGEGFSETYATNANQNNVRYYDCGCDTENGCTKKAFPSGSCQDALQYNYGYQSSRITCNTDNTTSGYCTDLLLYSGATCNGSSYTEQFAVACDSCAPFKGTYYKTSCGTTGVALANCGTDATCTQCNPATGYGLDACTVLQAGAVWAQSRGPVPCQTVQVEQFSEKGCTGTRRLQIVPQAFCTEHGVYTCTKSGQSIPAPISTATVLRQQCASGSFCSQSCEFYSAPAGSCVPDQYGFGNKVSCETKVSHCATFGVASDPQCNNMHGIISLACGMCSFTPGMGYMYLSCDSANSYVTSSSGCNSDCTRCEYTNEIVRELFKCEDGNLHPQFRGSNFYVTNFGVHECQVVKREIFQTEDCSQLLGTQYVQAGMCDGSSIYSCGDYNLQQVEATHCENCAAQPCDFRHSSGQCVSPNAGFSLKFTCGKKSGMCANLLIDQQSTTCAGGVQSHTNVKCGSVALLPHIGRFAYVACNADTMLVTLYNCTDGATCNVHGATLDFHPLFQCSQGLYTNMSIYNLGLTPCDWVQQQFFDSEDCSADSITSQLSRQTDVCSHDWNLHCAGEPYLATPAAASQQLLLRTCPAGSKNGRSCASSKCTSQAYGNGVCTPLPGGRSIRAACIGDGNCFVADSYGAAACSGAVNGTQNGICDSCVLDQGRFVRFVCDSVAKTVTMLTDCAHGCEQCRTRTPYTEGQCSDGVLVRGIFPCKAAAFITYSTASCSPFDIVEAAGFPEGHCGTTQLNGVEVDVDLLCGSYNLPTTPAVANATVTDCTCQLSESDNAQACFETMTVKEGECVSFPAPFTGSQTLFCNPEIDMCAAVIAYNGPECEPLLDHFVLSSTCGGCLKNTWGNGRTSYMKIACDFDKQTVTFSDFCDSTCDNCWSMSSNTVLPDGCIYDQFQGAAFKSLGVAPCASVTSFTWNTDGCGGTPAFSQNIAQGLCQGQSVECTNAPALPTETTATQILEWSCNTNDCSGHCEFEVLPTKTCLPLKFPGQLEPIPGVYQKASCGRPATCVDLEFYNLSGAAIPNPPRCDKQPMGTLSYVCGHCNWHKLEDDSTNVAYFHLACDAAAGTVTATRCIGPAGVGCDGCQGQRVVQTLQQQQCAEDTVNPNPSPEVYVRWTDLHPCSTVDFDTFTNEQCTGVAQTTVQRVANRCSRGLRQQCGSDFDFTNAPTEAPAAVGTKVFDLEYKAGFDGQAFSQGLQALNIPFSDVRLKVSADQQKAEFFFVGPDAAAQTTLLEQSLSNNAGATAQLFGASAMTARTVTAAPGTGPTTGAAVTVHSGHTNVTTPRAAPPSHSNLVVVEIVVGVAAGIGLMVVAALVVIHQRSRLRRQADSTDEHGEPLKDNTNPDGIEATYEKYESREGEIQ